MHHRTKCDTSLESWYSEVSENILYNILSPPLMGWEGGGGKKIQNFKCIIEPSVIYHWKAGILRFLKTYYTICLGIIPPLMGWEGGGNFFQNFKCIIEPSVIHDWKAGVLRFLKSYYTICLHFILYNSLHFCEFLSIYEGGIHFCPFMRGRKKIQNCHRNKV